MLDKCHPCSPYNICKSPSSPGLSILLPSVVTNSRWLNYDSVNVQDQVDELGEEDMSAAVLGYGFVENTTSHAITHVYHANSEYEDGELVTPITCYVIAS